MPAMDQIFIKDLLVRGIIGVYDWERNEPQDILINASLFTDIRKAAIDDDIRHSIDYGAVARKLQKHAESAQRLTVEALAEDLARICLEFPGVQKVRVRVEKPGAVRFAQSVGIEIERFPE